MGYPEEMLEFSAAATSASAREELIQLAACAVAAVGSIDRAARTERG